MLSAGAARNLRTIKARTEELLYLMFWATHVALRPTSRNLTDSFEVWAYRSGVNQLLAALGKAQLLESRGERPGDRIHRLTEAGRQVALGGCDPVARWNRRWDGTWRMVLFDVPQKQASARTRLRRSLAERGFGYLQNSVWITPDPLTAEIKSLESSAVDVESLIFLEARPCAGESDAEIVAGAWNFDTINTHYDRHAAVLKARPRPPLRDEAAARQWHRWLREERLAWMEVARRDPFLPKVLHPPGYRGMRSWKCRLEIMTEAGQHIRSFKAGR